MSNKVIIAAAGSGKTTHLIETALQARNAIILITTFTEENEKEIRTRFLKETDAYHPMSSFKHGSHFCYNMGSNPIKDTCMTRISPG